MPPADRLNPTQIKQTEVGDPISALLEFTSKVSSGVAQSAWEDWAQPVLQNTFGNTFAKGGTGSNIAGPVVRTGATLVNPVSWVDFAGQTATHPGDVAIGMGHSISQMWNSDAPWEERIQGAIDAVMLLFMAKHGAAKGYERLAKGMTPDNALANAQAAERVLSQAPQTPDVVKARETLQNLEVPGAVKKAREVQEQQKRDYQDSTRTKEQIKAQIETERTRIESERAATAKGGAKTGAKPQTEPASKEPSISGAKTGATGEPDFIPVQPDVPRATSEPKKPTTQEQVVKTHQDETRIREGIKSGERPIVPGTAGEAAPGPGQKTPPPVIDEHAPKVGDEPKKGEPTKKVARELPVPEGWTAEVGKTTTKEGHTYEAEVDWRGKRIVFSEQKHLDNPEIRNHEIAHVIYERILPEETRKAMEADYIEAKKDTPPWKKHGVDWIVKNQFHREEIAMDLGDYFSHPEGLTPEVRGVFERHLPEEFRHEQKPASDKIGAGKDERTVRDNAEGSSAGAKTEDVQGTGGGRGAPAVRGGERGEGGNSGGDAAGQGASSGRGAGTGDKGSAPAAGERDARSGRQPTGEPGERPADATRGLEGTLHPEPDPTKSGNPIPADPKYFDTDRGSIPGEPYAVSKDGRIALIEKEMEDGTGSLYSVVEEGGRDRGTYGTRNEAEAAAIALIEKSAESPKGKNYRITDADEIGRGDRAQKLDDLEQAVKVLRKLEEEDRAPTPEEQRDLARFPGWGWTGNALNKENAVYWNDRTNRANKHYHTYTRVRNLLTDEEFRAAEAATLNSHYTSPTVIKAFWKAMDRLGFKGGNALETSAGVGHFKGLGPEAIKWHAVELDDLTGRILKKLYPESKVHIAGVQKAPLPEGFDLAASNVPFGNYPITDRALADKIKNNPVFSRIHNYFFAKGLDKVRPGGIVAFITSHGTLDASDAVAIATRNHIAEQADFLGAIRLPNDTFRGNAKTDVTTDMIFLRKRFPDEPRGGEAFQQTQHIDTPSGIAKVNEYFINHPEMALGEHSMEGKTHMGGPDYALLPRMGDDIAAAMDKAIQNLPEGVYQEGEGFKNAPGKGEYPDPPAGTRQGSLYSDGKGVYATNRLHQPELISDKKADVRATADYVNLREQLLGHINSMQANVDDAGLAAGQAALKAAYETYVKNNGPLNGDFRKMLVQDPDSASVLSLEKWDGEEKKVKGLAPIFEKRNIQNRPHVESVDTAHDALVVSIHDRGKVDLPEMARLLGKSEREVASELKGQIWFDPTEKKWVASDEYGSGNVRKKLAAAIERGDEDAVEFLKPKQPRDLEPEEITANPGATWIPTQVYDQFMADLLKIRQYDRSRPKTNFSKVVGSYNVGGHRGWFNTVAATEEWGAGNKNFLDLFEDVLNGKQTTVTYKVDGKTVVDEMATTAARAKQDEIKLRFKDWVYEDATRAQMLADTYNREINNRAPRVFDGSQMTFPGKNPLIEPRPHQSDGAMRIVQTPTQLLHMSVGTGKSGTMAMGTMELKRTGIRQKILHVVPKTTLGGYAAAFRNWYPGAKILVAEDANFNPTMRKRFAGNIATGDWDAIIMSQEQYASLPMSPAAVTEFFREQIDALTDHMEDARQAEGKNSFTVKQIQRTIKSLEARLEKIQSGVDKRQDASTYFENLGIDHIMVDEAEAYKNLIQQSGMKGMAQEGSLRAFDMLMKTDHVRKNGGGITFASGTPISNSVSEMHTLMRYLAKEHLEESGMLAFDAWAHNFLSEQPKIKQDVAGRWQEKNVWNFGNIPELRMMYREVADMVHRDDVETISVPRLMDKAGNVTNKPIITESPVTDAQRAYFVKLKDRADNIPPGPPQKGADNMLNISTDGRKASIDLRLVDRNAEDHPDSKVNKAVANIVEIYKKPEVAKEKGTQIVFLDLGTPGSASFDLYADMKAKLVRLGVPEKEIAFAQEGSTDAKMAKIEQRMRDGEIRVLIASTEKGGRGINVQDRIVAVHHIDPTWKPSQIEQRDGRAIRQGNMWDKIYLNHYVVPNSFDSFMWDKVAGKAANIDAVSWSESSIRSFEEDLSDNPVFSPSEISAFATGNPMMEKFLGASSRLRDLDSMRSSYVRSQRNLKNTFEHNTAAVPEVEKAIKIREDVIKNRDEHMPAEFAMTVGKKKFTDQGEAGEALLKAAREIPVPDAKSEGEVFTPLGEFGPFKMEAGAKNMGSLYLWLTDQKTKHRMFIDITDQVGKEDLSQAGKTTLRRLGRRIEELDDDLQHEKDHLERVKREVADASEQIGKPWKYEAEYAQLQRDVPIMQREIGAETTKKGAGGWGTVASAPEGKAGPKYASFEEWAAAHLAEKRTTDVLSDRWEDKIDDAPAGDPIATLSKDPESGTWDVGIFKVTDEETGKLKGYEVGTEYGEPLATYDTLEQAGRAGERYVETGKIERPISLQGDLFLQDALSGPEARPGFFKRNAADVLAEINYLREEMASRAQRTGTGRRRTTRSGAADIPGFGARPEDIADAIKMGGLYAEYGLKYGAEWTAEMVSLFGEAVKPHLQQIYTQVRKTMGATDKVIEEEIGATLQTQSQQKAAEVDVRPGEGGQASSGGGPGQSQGNQGPAGGIQSPAGPQAKPQSKTSTVGISQEMLEKRGLGIKSGIGASPEQMLKRGRLIEHEADQRMGFWEKHGRVNGDDIAAFRARDEKLERGANLAFEDLENAKQSGAAAPEIARLEKDYNSAKSAVKKWAERIKPAETEWQRMGSAMQGKVELDTGSWSAMSRAVAHVARGEGAEPTAKEIAVAKRLSRIVQERGGAVEDYIELLDRNLKERAKQGTSSRTSESSIPATRNALRAYFADRIKNLAPKRMGTKQRGAVSLPVAPELILNADEVAALWQYVKDEYIDPSPGDLGLEEIVASVAADLDIPEESVIRALADVKGRTPTPEELAIRKARMDIRKGAKVEATPGYFAERKAGTPLDVDEAKALWTYARRKYLDNKAALRGLASGDEVPRLRHVVERVAADLGISTDMVREAFANGPETKEISDQMWFSQHEAGRARRNARMWADAGADSKVWKILKVAANLPRTIALAGHGTVATTTHAGPSWFDPKYFKTQVRGMRDAFLMSNPRRGGAATHARLMRTMQRHENYEFWNRNGLKIGMDYQEDYALQGGRFGKGMDVLKSMRLAIAEREWKSAPAYLKANYGKELAREIALQTNHMTGAVDTSKIGVAGKIAGGTMLAPSLEGSRWARVIIDPFLTARTGVRVVGEAIGLTKMDLMKPATPVEIYMAKVRAKRAGRLVGTYMGALLVNQMLLKATGQEDEINFFDPRRSDWLAFKQGGYSISPLGGVLGPLRLIFGLAYIAVHTPTKQEEILKGSRKRQTADFLFNWGIGKLNPNIGIPAEIAFRHDFEGTPLPTATDAELHGKERIDWWTYGSEHLPIPIADMTEAVREGMKEKGLGEVMPGLLMHAAGTLVGMRILKTPKQPKDALEHFDPAVKKEMLAVDSGYQGPRAVKGEDPEAFSRYKEYVDGIVQQELFKTIRSSDYQSLEGDMKAKAQLQADAIRAADGRIAKADSPFAAYRKRRAMLVEANRQAAMSARGQAVIRRRKAQKELEKLSR